MRSTQEIIKALADLDTRDDELNEVERAIASAYAWVLEHGPLPQRRAEASTDALLKLKGVTLRSSGQTLQNFTDPVTGHGSLTFGGMPIVCSEDVPKDQIHILDANGDVVLIGCF